MKDIFKNTQKIDIEISKDIKIEDISREIIEIKGELFKQAKAMRSF
jgi:hypothetical protein